LTSRCPGCGGELPNVGELLLYWPECGSRVIEEGLRVPEEAPGTVEGKPLDFKNRVVLPPRTRSEMIVTVPVRDLTSFINWLRDVGRTSVEICFEDYKGNEKGTIQVEGIPVYEQSWELGTNSTEVVPGG
jgi:hypothetical protein